jgi:lysozyme
MARHINDAGLSLIREFEGLRLEPYYDVAGKLTIGYGHLIRNGEKFDTITQAQAIELLKQDVLSTEVCVERWVRVSLTDNQFGALVCFAYNVGVTAFYKSSLLADLNGGHYDRVPAHLLSWDHAGGREVEGLKRRRTAEGNLWSTPDASA